MKGRQGVSWVLDPTINAGYTLGMHRLTFIFLIFLSSLTSAHPYKHPATWKSPVLMELLEHSPIQQKKLLQDQIKKEGKAFIITTDMNLLTLDHDVQAVFKWDLKPEELTAEIHAYTLSTVLGFPLIPPSVRRVVDGKEGMVQLFIDSPINMTQDDVRQKVMSHIDKDELAQLQLFYYLLGHWDGTQYNLLGYRFGPKTYLISIDHAKTCQPQYFREGEFPYHRLAELPHLKPDTVPDFPFEKAFQLPFEEMKKKYKSYLQKDIDNRFLFIPKPSAYVHFQKGLWCQKPMIRLEKTLLPAIPLCPKSTVEAIRSLTKEKLKKIGFNEDLCESILHRRSQILKKLT